MYQYLIYKMYQKTYSFRRAIVEDFEKLADEQNILILNSTEQGHIQGPTKHLW